VDVLARYEVGQVLDSGQECDTPTCEAWKQLIEQKQIPYHRAEAGMRMDIGAAVRLHVLHPPVILLAETSSDINNNSVVLRLEYGRFSVLLTGDIEQEAEEALLASGQRVDSLVLKVPHHGADSALTLPFLQAVNPELAVISVGSDNRFGHPGELTLENLQGMPSYRTDQQGTTEVVSDGERYWVVSQR
jgi:competence protein ComEC